MKIYLELTSTPPFRKALTAFLSPSEAAVMSRAPSEDMALMSSRLATVHVCVLMVVERGDDQQLVGLFVWFSWLGGDKAAISNGTQRTLQRRVASLATNTHPPTHTYIHI